VRAPAFATGLIVGEHFDVYAVCGRFICRDRGPGWTLARSAAALDPSAASARAGQPETAGWRDLP
jgi:hypothetical protein